jgi:hypothetical protein
MAQRIKAKTEAAKRIVIPFRRIAVFSVAEIVFIALLILGLEYVLPVCEALQGYNCQHEETTFRDINLAPPVRCPDTVKDYNKAMRQYFCVIQSTDTVMIKAWQCKLVVTKEVARCTWDRSAVTGIHWPLWQLVIKLDAEDCAKAVKDNEILYEGHDISFCCGVPKRNNWFSHGSVGKDGTCNWVSEVVTEGITYPWAYQNVKALL